MAKRMRSESSIVVRCHPGGCGTRSCGSLAACAGIDVNGAETCLHSVLFGAGTAAAWVPGWGVPVTTRVQAGAANSATAATVADSMHGSLIAPHPTFVAGRSSVQHPPQKRETQRGLERGLRVVGSTGVSALDVLVVPD